LHHGNTALLICWVAISLWATMETRSTSTPNSMFSPDATYANTGGDRVTVFRQQIKEDIQVPQRVAFVTKGAVVSRRWISLRDLCASKAGIVSSTVSGD
jgi:hypothetical protein